MSRRGARRPKDLYRRYIPMEWEVQDLSAGLVYLQPSHAFAEDAKEGAPLFYPRK